MASPDKPLAGKRIVLTRDPEQAREWIGALESLGAEVSLLPTIAFVPPEDWRELDEQLRCLDGLDAMIFFSRNAVRYVLDRCAQLGIKCEMLQTNNRMLAAVGPGTSDELSARGLHATFVSTGRTGESLARELGPALKDRKVLVPRGDRGDDRVLESLRQTGANVTSVIAYRTTIPVSLESAALARIRQGGVDAIVFASPSAFHNLSDVLGRSAMAALADNTQFAAIGPTTAAAIRKAGLRVEIDASDPSAAGLADALVKYFAGRATATTVRRS